MTTTAKPERAKTYRKAFVTLHEARYPEVPEGMTEAQAKAWLKTAKLTGGKEIVIAVDAIRSVIANEGYGISVPIKTKTRGGSDVTVYAQSPKITTSWVGIVGDNRYQVRETPAEIRKLITEAQRGAAV